MGLAVHAVSMSLIDILRKRTSLDVRFAAAAFVISNIGIIKGIIKMNTALITVKETAKLMKVKTQTILNWATGKVETHKDFPSLIYTNNKDGKKIKVGFLRWEILEYMKKYKMK
jgi:hypothetical protein